jgi:histone-lysine N-methyltransferase SUV39H
VNTSSSSSEYNRSRETSASFQPTGLSSKYYPVNAHETRAKRGVYPRAKRVDRKDISVIVPNMGPISSSRRPPLSRRHHLLESVEAKLSSIKGPPVTLAFGDHNKASLASNFEFLSSYKLAKGVRPVDDSFNAGCDCGPICNPQKCTCLSQEEDSDSLMIPYRRLQDGLLVLSGDFLKKTSMIYECSSHCSCDKNCWNRVVQHGRVIRLEIFHTGNRGFGKLSLSFFQHPLIMISMEVIIITFK